MLDRADCGSDWNRWISIASPLISRRQPAAFVVIIDWRSSFPARVFRSRKTIVLQGIPGAVWWLVLPQAFDQSIDCRQTMGIDQQCGDQYPLFGRWYRHL